MVNLLWIAEQALEIYIEGSPLYDNLKGGRWSRKKKELMEEFLQELCEAAREANNKKRTIRLILQEKDKSLLASREEINYTEWRNRQAHLRRKK